jgi:TonB family protein
MQKATVQFFLSAIALVTLSVSALGQSNLTAKANSVDPRGPAPVVESDRSRDGLVGPVRRVRTAISKLSNENGRTVEGKESVLEIVAYDIKGTKVVNQYFPIAGSTLTGKEVYKYDDKGNISEMTLVNEDGSLMSKEVYKYEFDFAGNWNKMTTSVAVIEGGRMSFEPTEVTHRSIMYYLDEKMMKMAQSAAPATSPSVIPINASVAKTEDKNSANISGTSDSKSRALPSMPARKMVTVDPNAAAQFVTSPASTGDSPVVRLDSEPPAPPAARPLLKPISGGVLNGTAISLPSPYYPENARRLRMSGVVVVEVVVDETGKVISANATSGPSALRDVAVQAALKARFSPTKLSGQPVKVSGVINYKFALSQ